jgi:hypothetical protein
VRPGGAWLRPVSGSADTPETRNSEERVQAPTAPGSSPAQEPDGRTCPGCGAANGTLAAFCWQCYQQFSAALAPMVSLRPGATPRGPSGATSGYWSAASGRPGAPATAPIPAPTSSGSRLTGFFAIVVALAVAAGVYVVMSRGPAAELPGSFGGLTKMEDEQFDAVMDVARSQAEIQGVEIDMGFYGSGGLPTAALAWMTADGTTVEGDPFAQIPAGFDSSFGAGSFDRSRVSSQQSGDTTIWCAPIVGTTPSNVCLWHEGDVAWILIDLSGSRVPATQTLAAAALAAAS